MSKRLHDLLLYEGPQLTREFEKASISGEGTPQEVADIRENALRDLVGRYFPFPYRVAKGQIVDSFDGASDSIDCVLLNPAHPHTVDVGGKFTVIMADAVDAAIELKPDLQDRGELHRGLKQMRSVRRLMRSASPLLLPSRSPEHIVEESRRVPTFLFADRVKSEPRDTAREILAFYATADVPPIEQVDFLVVNGNGIIANYKYPELTFSPSKHTGLFWEDWGQNTLAAFLYKLAWVIPSVAPVSEPILRRYLKSLRPSRFEPIVP